jgi:regulatory helix-turn-helix LysR family protein
VICTVFNLHGIDLNLLPVFEAAYEERSVSRAAARLAMTQSAVSHALSRLRAVFRDELFIRQARAILPTGCEQRLQTLVLGPARVAERPKRTCTSAVPAKKRVRASPYFVASALAGHSQCVVPLPRVRRSARIIC